MKFIFIVKKSKLINSGINNLMLKKSDENSEYLNFKKTLSKNSLKTLSGKKCLTKCYPRNVEYLHPVLLTGILHNIDSTCAIEPVHNAYSYIEDKMIIAEKCNLEDNNVYQAPSEIENLLLGFYFNATDFLSSIYGIHSFDEAIHWSLDNDHLPYDTIKRVHNCAWRVFGKKIDNLSSEILEYYYDLAKSYWLRDYVDLIRNKYSFNVFSNKKITEIENVSDEIYNILLTDFFSYNFFINCIKRYIYENQDNWENIDSHYNNIKKFVFNQLIYLLDEKINK